MVLNQNIYSTVYEDNGLMQFNAQRVKNLLARRIRKTEVATIMTINPKRRMLMMMALIDSKRNNVIDESACRTRATTKVMISKMLTNFNNK